MNFRLLVLAAACMAGIACFAQDTPPSDQQGAPYGQGRGRGGWGMMGGRGVAGTVTEVAADHYTIKTETGEVYTVHYSPNTRILKQPAQRSAPGEMRTPPEQIKASDIKVGDAIAAGGEIDQAAKSVGAAMVMKIDPQRAQQMREMQANFGKTWLMGKVTEVKETRVTLQSPVDNATHTFVADETTSFRKHREPVTLADVQVGDNVRVEGAMKEGVFVASAVNVMGMPSGSGRPGPREGPPPQ